MELQFRTMNGVHIDFLLSYAIKVKPECAYIECLE